MAKATKLIPLAAVLLLAALALPIPAAHIAEAGVAPSEVWVATTGSDSNPGTEAAPFATIQKGIDTLEMGSGGTVYVAAGTYHENLNISGAVDLIGDGAQNTIIDGSSYTSVIKIQSAPDTPNTISGFTIQNGFVISSLWNPADSQVLFAGVNLKFIKMLPQLFPPILFLGGGGIYIGETHIVTLNDCVIKDNQAEVGGGIWNNGQLYMNRCTVSGNSAIYHGGGIYNTPGGIGDSGKMWLTNCTISGNSASEGGGGIYNSPFGGQMNLSYVTIANNQATGASACGGGFNNWGQATFDNTIVANNTAGKAAYNNGFTEPAQGGVTTSMGYNLDSENSCNFNQPTDQINTDPLLGPLQDNGGPTFTHALLHGSPAIDAGNNTGAPATDQRGTPRPQGPTCDIGAYELTQASVNTATGTGTTYFSTLNGYITDLTALNESALPCPPRMDLDFPNGLFSFKVTDITPGSSATVVLIMPSSMPTDTEYWKCINGQWVDCTSLLGSNDGDSVLTLTITDGGLGDADGVANGTIVDPGGPAVAAATAVTATPSGPRASPSMPPPTQLPPPDIHLRNISVSPGQAQAGQPVTVLANVVNDGASAGSYNVALRINGKVEQQRTIEVSPGTAYPVKFTVTRSEPGTYDVAIDNHRASFTVLGSGSATGAPLNTGLIALLLMGILVLATVLVLILTRKPA